MIFSGKERRVKRFLKTLDSDTLSNLPNDLKLLSENIEDTDDLDNLGDKYYSPLTLLALVQYAGGVDSLFSMPISDLLNYISSIYGDSEAKVTQVINSDNKNDKSYEIENLKTAESAFKTWSDQLVIAHENSSDEESYTPSFSAMYSQDGSELLRDDEQPDEGDIDQDIVEFEEGDKEAESISASSTYEVEALPIDRDLIYESLNHEFGISGDIIEGLIGPISYIFLDLQKMIIDHYIELNKNNEAYPPNEILEKDTELRNILRSAISSNPYGDSEGEQEVVESFEISDDNQEAKVDSNKKKKRKLVSPSGVLKDYDLQKAKEDQPEVETDSFDESVSNWARIEGETLVSLGMSDEDLEEINSQSTSFIGEDEFGNATGKTYADKQNAALGRINEKNNSGYYQKFSIARAIDEAGLSEGYGDENKSLIHPIFKRASEVFSGPSLFAVDEMGIPSLRGDATDIIDYIEGQIRSLFSQLTSRIKVGIRSSLRGAKTFELRVEKANIAVGNVIEAAKIWDAYNESEANKFSISYDDNLRVINRVRGSDIFDLIVDLIKNGALIHYQTTSMEEKINYKASQSKVDIDGKSIANILKEEILVSRITTIVDRSLNIKYHEDWSNPFITINAITAVNFNNLWRESIASASSAKTGSKYISCPVCKKNIKYKNFSRKGGRRIEDDRDYKIREYSLIRPARQESSGGVTVEYPGGIISKENLNDHLGVKIEGEFELINWRRANELMSSPLQKDQMLGNRARHKILESLGAKPIHSVERNISSTKFSCPMSDYMISEKSVTSSECGYSLDISGISDDMVNLSEINTKFQNNIVGSSEPQDIFERINNSNISDVNKDIISSHIIRKRSGGWNFSDTHFACPCNISPKSLSVEDLVKFRERHKGALLAIPHIGFAEEESLTSSGLLDETYGNNTSRWKYHPPTDENGSTRFFEGGASGYLVCGTATSLSSFVRDPSNKSSIQALIKKYRQNGGEEAVKELIETLIKLGVDVSDILEIEEFFDSSINKSSRIESISKILKSAMAVNLSGASNAFSIIDDLGLRCGHGHTFTVGQSLRFGETHAADKADLESMSADGILGKAGADNFKYISERYFRPVTSSSDLTELIDISSPGSYLDNFDLSNIKFLNPFDNNPMSFSRSTYRNVRSKAFRRRNAQSSEGVYSYDLAARIDLGTINRDDVITRSTGVDAGDISASRKIENIPSISSLDLEDTVVEIFKMLSNSLDMIYSLRKTSQSLNAETILLDDDKECCDEEVSIKIKSILSSLFSELGSKQSFIDKLNEDLDEKLLRRLSGQKISSIRGYGRSGIESIISRIVFSNLGYDYGDIEEVPDQETASKIKSSVSRSVDLLIPRGYSYDDLFPNEPPSKGSKKIVLRRRAEHVGRQIMAGSAAYFSDVLADIIRSRFSIKMSSSMFSGLDAGFPQIDSEAILNMEDRDISRLRSKEYIDKAIEDFNKNNGKINKLKSSYYEAQEIISREIIRFRGVVTTQKYMSIGSDIASRGVDRSLDVEDENIRENIKKYIFGEDKIVNISLNNNSKYIENSDPGEFVGSYTSPTFISVGKNISSSIIHALSDGKNNYDTMGYLSEDEHSYFRTSEYSSDYFLGLSKGEVPYGCEPLPEGFLVSLSGKFDSSPWMPCLVKKSIDGKAVYKISKTSKLSILEHPETRMIKVEGGKSYYDNQSIGLNTSSGPQIGQQITSTDPSGINKLYPPSPYAPTGIGLCIPLDYSGSYDRKSGTFAVPHVNVDQEELDYYKDPKFRVPIQECNIQVDIGLPGGPVNAADFMKRSPKYAIPIFNEIEEIYKKAIKNSSGLEEDKALAIINLAKTKIKKLHNKYRSLPFEVEASKNRSGISSDGGIRNIGGLFISMWDYVTMYKLATHPAYSTEWGGPGKYSDPDNQDKIVQFISGLYNIDIVAEKISKKDKKDYSVEDILRGVKKSEKEMKFTSGITNNVPKFYSINSNESGYDPSMTIYTDWDYPGSGSGGDLEVSAYADRIERLKRVNDLGSEVRLSPSDIATVSGFYGKTGGQGSSIQAGPYGETKASDSTLGVYSFTARLRDFVLGFVMGRDNTVESSIFAESKFLSKISERKGNLRRIIFTSKVESLLDEIF
tara:strand:- start:989 stop:7336 length:6348 start_codon:yes stop_codon:yes gene_type:complete